MFGSDMLEKLKAMQNLAEESKANLDKVEVTGEAGGGLVRITLTGNKNFKNLDINTDHTLMEKEDLEDLISVALSKALQAADGIAQKEMMSSAKGMFPGF